MRQPTNVLNSTPDFVQGWDQGQPVLVPASAVANAGFKPISEAELAAGGQTGQSYALTDGANAGAKLTWAIPSGSTTYTWCWWLWPQAAY